jgi:hypothetical protein
MKRILYSLSFAVGVLAGALLTPVLDAQQPVDTELPTAAALADNAANPTITGTAAYLMCWDGSTWDRCGTFSATLDAILTEAQSMDVHLSTLEGVTDVTADAMKSLLVDSTGAALTLAEDYTVNADAPDDPSGPTLVCERDDALSALSEIEGDWTQCRSNANGAVWVRGEDDASMLTALQLIDNIVAVEDDGETAGGGLARVGAVRRDVAASSAGTTGDNATMNTDALGLLWTRNLDPCTGVSKQYIPIDITTATTTELTASLAGASTHYYVCSMHVVTAAANNVSLVDDDTDNCASVTSGLIGGLPAGEGWNLGANGGIALGGGNGSVMRTQGTNRVLCLVTSAATQLAGHIVVAAAP